MNAPDFTLRPPRLPAALAALLVAGTLACEPPPQPAPPDPAVAGEAPDPEPAAPQRWTTSLLRRQAASKVEETGQVRVSLEDGWGELGLMGWHPRGTERSDGLDFVFTRERTAALRLPALGAGERDLEILMWIPHQLSGGVEEQVEVLLNGRSLSTLLLGARPSLIKLATRSSDWEAGDNRLELRHTAERKAVDGVWRGVAVNSVRYGRSLKVLHDREEPSVLLPQGTAISFDHERAAPTELSLAGAIKGAGHLELSFDRVDARNSTQVLPDPDPPLRIFAEAGRLAAEGIPLPDPEGKILRLRFEHVGGDERSALRLERLDLSEERERPPSIVFVSIDTLAANHTSLYGYERDTTPTLVRLAEESITFEQARSNAPWTLPSYMSQMTGLFPEAHAAGWDRSLGIDPEFWDHWFLSENRWTLAEMLQARGYRTAGFVDNLWITEKANFAQGFDVYDTSAGRIPHSDPEGGLRHVTKLALEWLDSVPGDEPIFLFLHAFDVHGPYRADPPHKDRYEEDELWDERMAPAGGVVNAFRGIPESIARGLVPEGEVPEKLPVAELIATYDEGIRQMDSNLAELLEALRQRDLWDNAVFALSSDHGESMDGHEYYFGHGVLYDDVVRVPLMVRLPGGEHGGRRVTDGVQLVDLFPTFAALAGAPVERSWLRERDWLHGRSLTPLLEGVPTRSVPSYAEAGIMRGGTVYHDGWKLIHLVPGERSRAAVFLTHPALPEGWRREHLPELEGRALRMPVLKRLMTSSMEVVEEARDLLSEDRYELYYLPDDPGEEHDLAAEEPERVEQMIRALRIFYKRRNQARLTGLLTPESRVTFDEEELKALEGWGYLDTD